MAHFDAMASLPGPGDQIHQYTVLFEVARGGMAAVYAASVKGPGGFEKVVALKTILPGLASERRFTDMFLDEARIAARIDHPNVVEVYEVREHEGSPILAMELVEGRSLAVIAREPPFPPLGVKLRILAAAARGLHAAHETVDADGVPLGIVHRDVSPHNVLVGLNGRIKLTDFGIAAARGRITHTASGEMKGKMSYLAPEQITREVPTDRRADVWGLGVIAWELLAERKLFAGADDAQRMYSVLSQPIPSLSTIVPDAPPACVEAIARALEREVPRRLPSVDRLADVFEAEATRLGTTEIDVAAYMRSRFSSDVVRDRERITESLTLLSAPLKTKPNRGRVLGWAAAILLSVAVAAVSTAFIASELDAPAPAVSAEPPSPPASAVATAPMPPTEVAAPEETAEVADEPADGRARDRRRRRRAAMNESVESSTSEPAMRLDSMQILPNPF